MSTLFHLGAEERKALAAELRGASLIETLLTPEMEADMARVTVTELSVPTRIGPARVLHVVPKEATGPLPLFVNMHGGGFVRGYQERDTVFCAGLASRVGCAVLDIDYRLAPEHPFPAALHECHDVAAWAVAHAGDLDIDPARVAIGGHSAGGNLATAICLMALDSGLRFCGQVLDYPFLDGLTPPEEKLEPQSIFPPARLHAFNALYAGVPGNLSNPLLSPVLAAPEALAGLPPALIVTAGKDPLRFEAQRYAGQLIAAGVDVCVRQFRDCDHGFVIAGQGRWAEGRALISRWLGEVFDTTQGRTE